MSKDSEETHSLDIAGRNWRLTEAQKNGTEYQIRVDGKSASARIIEEPRIDHPDLVAEINGRIFTARILERNEDEYVVRLNGHRFGFSLRPGQRIDEKVKGPEEQGPVLVSAPMSGRVISLNISTETRVTSGQSLIVLEAMKMQNDISAPKSGVVRQVYVQAGSLVKAGDRLCMLE